MKNGAALSDARDSRPPRIDICHGDLHLAGMPPPRSQTPQGTRMSVFPVACWILGMMGFTQLLVAGLALSARFESSRQVRVVEREVWKPVALPPSSLAANPALPSVVARPPVTSVGPVVPEPRPMEVPAIAVPRAERMVNEARAARVAGDMGRAIVKLEEALAQAPEDPTIQYELGLVHEQMGVFDTASAHYEKVFQMGAQVAGVLYAKAAAKLRDGFEQPADMLGKLSLGRVRIFNDANNPGGQRVILTIPVQKGPSDEIDVSEIAVSVVFFNRTSKGEIVQLEDKSWVTEQWVSLPFDWAGGEESLRMTYIIPPQDNPTEHLFGARSYYGQVVSLLYQNEVLDVQAWPRDLAARIPKPPTAGPGDSMLPEFQDKLPPDFDPDVPLLPALPTNK